ncbi:MAG: hypothetical protein AB1736_13400 [Chloroflexota bacterium]
MNQRIDLGRGARWVVAAILMATMIQAAFAASVAAQPVLGGFQGSWTTIDCADPGTGQSDCAVWGDASTLSMQIGFGKHPKVSIKDDLASACVDSGAASARWSGSGSGWYTQDVAPDGTPGPIYLHVVLARAGCGALSSLGDLARDMPPDATELEFYHDLGSDTIWFDPDGVNGGLVWVRTN